MDCVDTCPAGPNNVDADNDGIPGANMALREASTL